MTPRQLKYFVEIARTGSFTTAAASLHIAQPALSHHVAAMEQELGVSLLLRHARGVTPTAEGRRLLDRATSILAQMERLRDDVRDASAGPRGVVRLCLVASAAPLLAVPLLKKVQARYPAIRLQVMTALSHEARALVEARRVDLALLPVAADLSRMQALPVFAERMCLIGTAALLGDERGPIRFAQVGERALAAPDRDHDLRKLIERTALSEQVTLNVRYEINSAELQRSLVLEGMACAIMPPNAFAPEQLRALVVREIDSPAIDRVQSIVSGVDHPLTAAGEAVREALLELVDDLVAGGVMPVRRLG